MMIGMIMINIMIMIYDDRNDNNDYDEDDARSSWPLELIQPAAQLTSSSTPFIKS